ncbi:hypothetical protein KKH82_01275, partial [Patescibacteria group bacterium]|nr:hypothetical protein [Patescibacteria group bacterium]
KDNFLLMEDNLKDNHIVAKTYENALYNKKCAISFDDSLRDDSKRIDINGKSIVSGITITDLLDKNKKYDIMKIDIE